MTNEEMFDYIKNGISGFTAFKEWVIEQGEKSYQNGIKEGYDDGYSQGYDDGVSSEED